MLEIHLFDIFDFPSELLVEAIDRVAGREVADQLKSVIIPVQRPNGNADKFSILALTYPRLTSEEKRSMEFGKEVTYNVCCQGISIGIELDEFKRVNWVHVEGGARSLELLSAKIRSVVEAGGNKFDWQK